ncbi:TPA: hypothetical protein ACOTGW_001943 [Clostridium perfringens]|uniref:hypothetical protein n=1 Tax=Clostridium perfringens TaxID=1502 RepID=UPI000D71288C|nr:hypothetical protein [Clostridium perfringens]EGT4142056.1 hypothetical protein [Clostridium perfringens]MBO3408002.1 hypothetical protein [Clostridium perfringens]MBO3430524.1 hypothetical protein [Clostridium perfringens]MDK0590331.1 hypothetical protein [Clostridium perfringens]MDK0802768.1 hypothetical protein [Clostridium perfringens]
MRKSFFKKYLGPDNYIATIISLITGIIVTLIGMNNTIPMYIFLTYVLISSLFIWYLSLKIYFKDDTNESITLVMFKKYNNNIYCVLNESKLLAIGAYITLFYYEDNFEQYLGTAKVENIQANKIIQAKLENLNDENFTSDKILSNNKFFLSQIIIKPIITDNFLSELQ